MFQERGWDQKHSSGVHPAKILLRALTVSICVQREQMFTFEITFLPASLPSLATSYQRVRMAVGYPDGGVSNNMAVAFLPGAVLDAGGVGFDSDNGTASWSVQPMPQSERPSSNDALAFLTVRIIVIGICFLHVQNWQPNLQAID